MSKGMCLIAVILIVGKCHAPTFVAERNNLFARVVVGKVNFQKILSKDTLQNGTFTYQKNIIKNYTTMSDKQRNFSKKIGEAFTFFRGNAAAPFPIILRVKEVAEPKCIGCYFYRPDKKSDNNPIGCTKIFAYAGNCDEKLRPDKKNVIFVAEEYE